MPTDPGSTPDRPAHKRSKSGIARSLLNRVTSKTDDTPPLPGTSTSDDRSGSMDSTNYTPPRQSMSHRPNLSTTISGFNKPAGEASLYDEPVNTSALTQGATIEQSVRLFKVFEALRNGDTAAVSKVLQADGEANLQGTTVLHLAIQCADQHVVEYVLTKHALDVNARDKDGNTPLHIAAQLGRVSIVKLLLDQPNINDSITNYHGKTALDSTLR